LCNWSCLLALWLKLRGCASAVWLEQFSVDEQNDWSNTFMTFERRSPPFNRGRKVSIPSFPFLTEWKFESPLFVSFWKENSSQSRTDHFTTEIVNSC
jgi:hypothetical protein